MIGEAADWTFFTAPTKRGRTSANEALAQRFGDRLGLGVDLQLLVNMPHVRRHRIDRDTEFPRRRLVDVTLAQQGKQPQLLRSEMIAGVVGRAELAKELHHAPGNL